MNCLMKAGWILLAVFFFDCGPSIKVPVRYIGPNGVTDNKIKCCDVLNCQSQKWDYCQDDGEEYQDGVYYNKCSCHDYASSSSSSSSSSRDGNKGWDKPDNPGKYKDPCGHKVPRDK